MYETQDDGDPNAQCDREREDIPECGKPQKKYGDAAYSKDQSGYPSTDWYLVHGDAGMRVVILHGATSALRSNDSIKPQKLAHAPG
jgi:hypothetical protein